MLVADIAVLATEVGREFDELTLSISDSLASHFGSCAVSMFETDEEGIVRLTLLFVPAGGFVVARFNHTGLRFVHFGAGLVGICFDLCTFTVTSGQDCASGGCG